MITKFKLPLISEVDFEWQPETVKSLKIEDIVLVKQTTVTGWGWLAKVIRTTKTQIEVEIINLLPTLDVCKIATVNPFKNRGEGFFEDWAWWKKQHLGRKRKFFKDTGIEVGSSNDWKPLSIAILK
tara:strand:- start:199 stop:576 length:378 start_codon:yes stop_codon:yes gene_type:complete